MLKKYVNVQNSSFYSELAPMARDLTYSKVFERQRNIEAVSYCETNTFKNTGAFMKLKW